MVLPQTNLLRKRWVRIVGLVPMTVYSFLACLAMYAVLSDTVFRPPNHVFPMTDMPGWIGYLFFLGIIVVSGAFAIATAFLMGGVFRVLYVSGPIAIVAAMLYLPLSFTFNATVDFHPDIEDQSVMIGTWVTADDRLSLFGDSTYVLTVDGGSQFRGTWRFDNGDLFLSHLQQDAVTAWPIFESGGYYFITHSIPANFDAWSGDLGFMRESDWIASH